MKTAHTLPFDPRFDLMTNAVKRSWVDCPICGEPDMRREEDAEGNVLILCTNHACASNGGMNNDALIRSIKGSPTMTVAAMAQVVADHLKNLEKSS